MVRWRLVFVAVGLLVACTGKISPSAVQGAANDNGAGGMGGNSGPNKQSTGGASAQGAADEPFVASDSVARRLTRVEFDHALADLFSDDRNAASTFLPEDPYSPYDNDYTGQIASGALIDSLSSLADDVAAYVIADPTLRARIVPCTPADNGDADCFTQVVTQLTRRAFRRDVTSVEVDRYLVLLDFATEDNPDVDNDFYTAVELLIRAILMDPEFLYRIEVGEPTGDEGISALTDYEIATRLSFLLWGTIPDDELLSDAEAGRLSDADGRLAIAQRMLKDARAKQQLQRFHAMWLGYRKVPHGPDLAAAFQRETSALIDRIVFDEPQAYSNLFTFDATFIDSYLAQHYGLPEPTSESWVLYGDSGRAGLLSHGSFLSAFGKFSDTSPTQRGILVRSRLLCQKIDPPPPTVMADKPPGDDSAVCKYDRYEAHRASAACAGCHAQMDPIGFGLENYDLAGRFREHDDGLPQCTIAGTGELPPYGSFSGPAELGKLLVQSGELEHCVVSQFLSFAVGRALQSNETQEVDRLTEAMLADGAQLTSLIKAHIESDAFAMRKEPTL